MASLYLSGLFKTSLLSLTVKATGATLPNDRGVLVSPTKQLKILTQLDGKPARHSDQQPLSGGQETESIYEGHIIKYWYDDNEGEAIALLSPPEVTEGAVFPGVINELAGTVHVMASEQTSFLVARAAGFGDRVRVKLVRRIDQRKT